MTHRANVAEYMPMCKAAAIQQPTVKQSVRLSFEVRSYSGTKPLTNVLSRILGYSTPYAAPARSFVPGNTQFHWAFDRVWMIMTMTLLLGVAHASAPAPAGAGGIARERAGMATKPLRLRVNGTRVTASDTDQPIILRGFTFWFADNDQQRSVQAVDRAVTKLLPGTNMARSVTTAVLCTPGRPNLCAALSAVARLGVCCCDVLCSDVLCGCLHVTQSRDGALAGQWVRPEARRLLCKQCQHWVPHRHVHRHV